MRIFCFIRVWDYSHKQNISRKGAKSKKKDRKENFRSPLRLIFSFALCVKTYFTFWAQDSGWGLDSGWALARPVTDSASLSETASELDCHSALVMHSGSDWATASASGFPPALPMD